MLDEEDLQVAVAEGIVSEAQAASLRELVKKRELARAEALGHEERFTFMKGFNDFFFAVGIVLFAGGMAYFASSVPAGCLIAALVTWALAELLVGRMRLVLPGILLAVIFVGFFTAAMPIDFWYFRGQQSFSLTALLDWFTSTRAMSVRSYSLPHNSPTVLVIIYALVGAVAAALFYLRFRLPFALLPIAASLVGAALATLHHYYPEHGANIRALVLLGCGLVTFIAAMAFDFSDRERMTRRADCAFWLHLLAAPLIVHSLITMVAPEYRTLMSTPVAMAIVGIFAVLTVIAIIVDRRALLVSALVYVGVVIAYAITQTVAVQTSDGQFVFFATILALGALVLMLGLGWRPLRRAFVGALPNPLSNRLPPVAARA